jgi:CHAD domain-containing protein
VLVQQRYLPAVPEGFVLGEQEPLSAGLQRITIEQFETSIARLTGSDDIDAAVHAARKSMKRLRAVLRLVRPELGNKVYRAENAILRDTARLLAPMRDGQVMASAISGLRNDFEGQLAPDALAELEDLLWERHLIRRQHVLDDRSVFPTVIATLRAGRNRYAAWPVESLAVTPADPLGRKPIPDVFSSVGGGLGQTYARGRNEMDLAISDPTAHHFHQWRKRVKYLRHQVEILEPLWPEMMSTYARSLDDLGEILGEEHDMAVLVDLLATDRSIEAPLAERALAGALAEHRRGYLQQAAIVLGKRAYAETPRRFTERMESYWDASRQPG